MSKKINLGQLAEADAQRDALHTPVAPIIAGETLKPGARVKIRRDGRAILDPNGPGIVDSFLTEDVTVGQTFWLLVKPGEDVVLNHQWSHPQIPIITQEEQEEYDGCRGCW